MKEPIQEILDTCHEMIFNGKDYLDVKKYLESLQLEKEAEKLLLLKADEMLVQYQLFSQHKTQAINVMLAGGLILLIGLAFTIGTYILGKSRYILAYGIILSGAWILKRGYAKYRLSPEQALQSTKGRKGKFERY
ncbi:MAG: hypothetical protein KDC34_11560 [Saprospiraceae bacterium]|nr:hypothetical protein [Saprospiraceae bacterium]